MLEAMEMRVLFESHSSDPVSRTYHFFFLKIQNHSDRNKTKINATICWFRIFELILVLFINWILFIYHLFQSIQSLNQYRFIVIFRRVTARTHFDTITENYRHNCLIVDHLESKYHLRANAIHTQSHRHTHMRRNHMNRLRHECAPFVVDCSSDFDAGKYDAVVAALRCYVPFHLYHSNQRPP